MSEKKAERVRLSLEVSPEFNELLESLIEGTGSTNKSEVLRKAISLMGVAVEAKKSGEKLYISDEPPPGRSREIVGI
jgi:hypothetical protein